MGLEFYQTKMGQRFFNADVPRLIDALEQIGSHLQNADGKGTASKNEENKIKLDFGSMVLVAASDFCGKTIRITLEDESGNLLQNIVTVELAHRDSITVKVCSSGGTEYADMYEINPKEDANGTSDFR